MNPLSTQVTFRCETSHPDIIRFSKSQFIAHPHSEASVDVLFRPVLPGQGEATVHISCTELGDYPYAVHYEATPAALERSIMFKAPLGTVDKVQSFKFLHYARKPATYVARIEPAPGHAVGCNDFVVESKDIRAAASTGEGIEMSVDIRFQPSCLGEIRALLALSSPEGGDYKVMLEAVASAPQPQGPVVIQNGKQGSIEFHNPFETAVTFTVQVDHTSFMVANRTLNIEPKKSQAITVQFKAEKPQTARMMVTAQKFATPWVFLLKGTMV